MVLALVPIDSFSTEDLESAWPANHTMPCIYFPNNLSKHPYFEYLGIYTLTLKQECIFIMKTLIWVNWAPIAGLEYV